MKLRTVILLIITCLLGFNTYGQSTGQEVYLVKVLVAEQSQKDLLLSLNPDYASEKVDKHAEVIVNKSGLLELQDHGFEIQIIRELNSAPIDEEYHRYNQVLELLDEYAKMYPDITFLDTIGVSQRLGLYIPAIKISDNAKIEEDEPAILYDGLHHAREPAGMESTLEILKYLLTNYGHDQQVTNWVDNTEIWIVPMMNPEGWYYLVENELGNPWWRKNLRENGNNAVINPDNDGVDLNRNYDSNWEMASGDPGSWTYKGPEPFSESETRAKRDLALSQKFVMSLSYHSYGEIIIYGWRETPRAPDQDLIIEIADSIASRIPKFNKEGSYDPSVSHCESGFSRCWMYKGAGTIEYTVETAPSFMPSGEDGLKIAKDNLQGGLYLLERVRGAGLTGHITDKLSGKPLDAEYRILEIYNDILAVKTSDSLFGRYDRLLQPGEYTLEISKEGYLTETIPNIQVRSGAMTDLDITLIPIVSGIEDIHALPYNSNIRLSQNYPNPFKDHTTIKYYTAEEDDIRIDVINILGKTVASLVDEWHTAGEYTINWDGTDSAGQKLPSGFYYYRLTHGRDAILRVSTTRKMVIH